MKYKIIEQAPKKEDTLIAVEEKITETRELRRFTINELKERIAVLNTEIDRLTAEKTELEKFIKEAKKL